MQQEAHTGQHDRVPEFATLLRHWRKKRGYSQLNLSVETGISQRHISFLECGRAQPSRKLVLTLGRFLAMPVRDWNDMLLSAGYAPCVEEHNVCLDQAAVANAR